MNIVITGASQGIGFQTALAFASHSDHSVAAIARREKELMLLEKKCQKANPKTKIFTLPFDLRSGKIDYLRSEIQKHFAKVDVLINNAGALVNKSFEELNEEDFDLLFDVNVKSVFKLVKSLLPMFNPESHIINISSMGGYQGSAKFPGLSLYSASKGAVSVLTECMAEEFKDKSISVNCLALGAVQTEMLENAFPGYKAPLSASEMADFIYDFAISGHKYFNGKILPVTISTP